MSDDEKIIQQKIAKHNIGSYEKHIFLCTGPSCCSEDKGKEVWDHLKETLAVKDPDKKIFRTKAGCLRICKAGPVALVYPDGTLYRDVNKEALDKIIDRHLLGGSVVEELKFAENPLGPGANPTE